MISHFLWSLSRLTSRALYCSVAIFSLFICSGRPELRIVIDSICGLLCPKLDVDAEAEASMALLFADEKGVLAILGSEY